MSATSLIAAGAGGCGGGAAATADGGLVHDGAPSGDFITAEVNGATVRAGFEPSAGTSGVGEGLIWVVAGRTSMLDGWNLYIPNSVGTSDCPPSWLALFEVDVPTVCSDAPGATCSVTVTSAAPALGDVMAGTFTATLTPFGTASPSAAQTAVVANGAFHVTRNFE